ncbi:MAG: hypothetical protein JWN94_521 [Betaproteobacteria bacterium]|nr:hypothetical protein [Betaproteobacteria bacterium]
MAVSGFDRETPLPYGWLRWWALALSVVASLGGWYFYEGQVRKKAQAEFHASAIGKTNEIDLRTHAYADVLYALRGLFDASAAVTRDDFHRFAAAISLPDRYPGLTNISYSPLIRLEQKGAFERAVRAESSELIKGLPEFSIEPAGERPEYMVLHYMEPLNRNVPAWGLDLLADSARRAPVERARDLGVVTSVSGITLLRDGKSAISSALLRLAVYRGGGVPDSAAERRRLLSGVVGSTLRIGELIEATLKADVLARMRVRIFAGADASAGNGATPEEQVLYDSLPVERATSTIANYVGYTVNQNLAVGDRVWRISITPLVDPVKAFDYAMVYGVLAVSLALAGLLFWLMSSLATVQRREADLAQRGREAVLLTSLGGDLHSCQTVQEACHVLAIQMPELLARTSGKLYVIDASRRRALAGAHWGEPGTAAEEFAPADCEALRRDEPVLVETASAATLKCGHFAGLPPRMYVCVPLMAQGEAIGLLHIQSGPRAAPVYSEAELNVIRATAQHLALALSNLGLREKLFERATHDNLTGLYNRHYMREWFEQELLRAGRHRRSIGMILVDVDHFKRVNDTFGHDAGDLVLRELAAVIRRIARSSDVACRHGGEEFLLLMPDATPAGTRYKAEKLRQAVAAMALEYDGHPLRITVSAGVAVYPDHGIDVDALLRAADEALYAAKGAGRNCVIMHEAHSPAPAIKIARLTRNHDGAPPAVQHDENCNEPDGKAAPHATS